MRLTPEGAIKARQLIEASGETVPRATLTNELYAGDIETVARVAAYYFRLRTSGALEYYVLALIQGGSTSDIRLAKELILESLQSQRGTEGPSRRRLKRSTLRSYLDAAAWVSRFDIPLYSDAENPPDLSLRLQVLAAYHSATKVKDLEKRERAVEIVMMDAAKSGFSSAEITALRSLHAIAQKRLAEAFKDLFHVAPEDKANPYVRMACHQLFGAVPMSKRIDFLEYGEVIRSYGVGFVPGQGMLLKEFTGEGFLRNAQDISIDSNFAPIELLIDEELRDDISSGELALGKRLNCRKLTAYDLKWTPWLDKRLAAA